MSYRGVVKESLREAWSQFPLLVSSRINRNDLTVGKELFDKIVVEAVEKEFSVETKQFSRYSLEIDTESETQDKIKAFVKDYVPTFIEICATKFPFNALRIPSTEMALKLALEDGGSILSHFMHLEGTSWMSEAYLNNRFGRAFQHLQIGEIARTCSDLSESYSKGDYKAGYYLLWFIKQSMRASNNIPGRDSFDGSTVAKVLSSVIASQSSPANLLNLVKILYFRSEKKFLYEKFLDEKSRSIFFQLVLNQLKSVPMDQWPGKAAIILHLLEPGAPGNKLPLAQHLSLSKDPATSIIGRHLEGALTVLSPREAMHDFNRLKELLPSFTFTHMETIAGRPFQKFIHDKTEFVKLVCFNRGQKVFIEGSLMIGVHGIRGEAPPYLLAYDRKTEKLAWGIPLSSNKEKLTDFHLERVGEHISLHFTGGKEVHFIDPKTGGFHSTFELPEAPKNKNDSLHMSSEGFTYQTLLEADGRVLIGGRIINGEWVPSFKGLKTPIGTFTPLSTHCGFALREKPKFGPREDFKEELVLFGPTGDQVTIPGCMEARVQGDRLYTIERGPGKYRCSLNVRTLKMGPEVVSDIETSFEFNARRAFFGGLCQEEQVVLFLRKSPNIRPAFVDIKKKEELILKDCISPVFVDIKKKEVIFVEHSFPFNAKHITNTHSGEVWILDEGSVWRVSSTEEEKMGYATVATHATLLHVDEEDQFYFANI